MGNSMEPKQEKLTKEQYGEGTRALLRDSQREPVPYTTKVLDREFLVLPNVFSPKYFKDTEEFAKHLPIRQGDEALEIGPGTGAVIISAVLRGAKKGIAIDINPDALRNSQENVKRFNLEDKIDIRSGDVYDSLKPGEKFDVIFWNVPFELIENADITPLEKAVFDPGYRSIARFISEAAQHLNPNGRLYVGFSSTLGDYPLLRQIAGEAGYDLLTIYSVTSTEVHPDKFEIIEAIKRKG